MKKIIIMIIAPLIFSPIAFFISRIFVNVETDLCISSLNNGGDVIAQQTIHRLGESMYSCFVVFIVAYYTVVLCLFVYGNKKGKSIMKEVSKFVGLLAFCLIGFVGCKPYDKPSFEEIPANATAFVIPLEGMTEKQDAFQSVELLQQKMVATKRIQIPHRWVKSGRMPFDGKYVDTVKVMMVDRTPVTRSWTTENKLGLEAESRDSLEINTGFTLTAYIDPSDAALFLFRYKGDGLARVIDSQVKNSIQSAFSKECSKYNLVELPLRKSEIVSSIKEQIIPFYKQWGISIAADMGFLGGLTYEPKIQDAFNKVFESQKSQERAQADKIAQDITNQKDLAITVNEAEKIKVSADAEAYAVQKKAEAIKLAGDIYIQSQFITKWDGVLPKVSSGANMMNMIQTDLK